MATNYFQGLPVPKELKDALSLEVEEIGGGGGGGGGAAYVLPGTYEPTVSTDGDLTAVVFGLIGYMRVGPGPGPAVGDVVTLFGTISVSNAEAGARSAQLSIPVPFDAVEAPTGPAAATYQVIPGQAASITAYTTASTFVLDVGDWLAASTNAVWFQAQYITANAIDP